MITCNGAECIIHLLERQGIGIVAGIPGGANLPLYDALGQSDIRHVLTRHEQGAGFIAQGMARSTGKPAVFFATSGPGATNTLTAIADAKLDSVPVICITGQTPTGLMGTDAFQEVDTYGLSIPITKHNFLVRDALELLWIIPEAFRIATSGRPGPVLIDVPRDVQTQSMNFPKWPQTTGPEEAPEADMADILRAAMLLEDAERPILYLGGGVVAAADNGACQLAREFAEKASMPMVSSLMGLGAVPAEHPMHLGMLGMHAAMGTNMLLEEADLIFAAGVRFDDRATGKVAQFCPNAAVVHVDIDPAELDKLKQAHVGITGDVAQVLQSMMPHVRPKKRAEWLSRAKALKSDYGLQMPGVEDPRTPYGLIRAVSSFLPEDAIIATDVGQHQMWTAQAFPHKAPRQWLTSGGLGTMGFGLPAAIGAALAHPERKVVCFSGDGSVMMNIQELATAAEQGVNLTIVLYDNSALGLVRQQQDFFCEKRYVASSYSHQVDFAAIARGFGLQAYDLGDGSAPMEMLRQALSHDGPCLLRAPISQDERVLPMVPPGAANSEMIGGYENACATA